MAIDNSKGIFRIEFNSSIMPVFKETRGKDYVYYGERNDYPAFLIDLYNKHPVHAAILKSKVKYISGKGLYANPEEYNSVVDIARADLFLSVANRYEDWTSVYKKTVDSLELFNGFAWQVIWNLGGTRCEVYCMQFAKVRVSADGSKIFYSDNWINEDCEPVTNPKYTEFKAFNPNDRKGTQVFYYKVTEQYATGIGDVYPLPEYKGAIMPVYTDIAVSQFQNDLALNGFTAQGMLTLFKGEPDEAERRKLERLFDNKFVGPGNRKSKVMLNFTDNGDVGAEYTNFQVSDLDKQFEGITKKNREDIISGHQIPNKGLVGISTEGALSDRTAIDLGFEQLQNTYVEPRQDLILCELKMIGEICGYDLSGVCVKKLKPLGINYLDPALKEVVTKDEIRKHLGLEPLDPPVQPGTTPTGPINENLRALSGKDWIHIKRLVREVKNGKTPKEAAAMMIRSAYGLSDQDINVLFGEQGEQVAQFNEQRKVDDIIKMFEMAAQDDNDDEIVSTAYCFASKLDDKVLEILKGEPTATANKIATMLGEPVENINNSLAYLNSKGLIESNNQPTDKGLEKKTPETRIEVYTVYKYVTRPDVPRAQKTRPFCQKLLDLAASGKVWTKEAIDNLTNDIGEDAWAYRGGFYHNPDTGETTPYCRHIWASIVKTRRK